MADPGEGDLAAIEFRKNGLLVLAGARGQKGLPDHLAEERAGVEGFGWSEVFEGFGEGLADAGRTDRLDVRFRHNLLIE